MRAQIALQSDWVFTLLPCGAGNGGHSDKIGAASCVWFPTCRAFIGTAKSPNCGNAVGAFVLVSFTL
jgi:hypothetical protein